MNDKLHQYIKNKLSVAETEIWDFSKSESRVVDPTLQTSHFNDGLGIYLVPTGFCGNQ